MARNRDELKQTFRDIQDFAGDMIDGVKKAVAGMRERPIAGTLDAVQMAMRASNFGERPEVKVDVHKLKEQPLAHVAEVAKAVVKDSARPSPLDMAVHMTHAALGKGAALPMMVGATLAMPPQLPQEPPQQVLKPVEAKEESLEQRMAAAMAKAGLELKGGTLTLHKAETVTTPTVADARGAADRGATRGA